MVTLVNDVVPMNLRGDDLVRGERAAGRGPEFEA
jgi:hypothetical protein